MVNINQSENENEELKLSPLGTDEINSVIKSFKNSTFNQEELYKKDKKNFVKKTLFDLAKESERISSEENQSKTDNSSEENVGESQEIVKDINQNDGPDNIHSFNDIDENNNNEKEADYVEENILLKPIDYYYTNSIARSSKVMSECRQISKKFLFTGIEKAS